MSIRSNLGNLVHNFQNTIASALNTAKTQIANLVGNVSTNLSNIWAGGFTGMSEAGMSDLKTALTTYCSEIQDLISSFDQNGDITSALKGDVQQAAYDYIDAVKQLLQAYVSTMKQSIAEADEAYQNFLTSSQSIAKDVTNTSSEIRSKANDIKLD